jgi:hypothetical protein
LLIRSIGKRGLVRYTLADFFLENTFTSLRSGEFRELLESSENFWRVQRTSGEFRELLENSSIFKEDSRFS